MSMKCWRCQATARRSTTCLTGLLLLVLLLSAATVRGQDPPQTPSVAEDPSADDVVDFVKIVANTDGWRPFLALKDTTHAASKDVQRLYEQSGQGSAIAYLLFAAARPLSQADGSSNALLPYLTPTVLRLYMSQPGRCSSPLAEDLYSLSQSMYGTSDLQACHYDLYTALESVFSWVRDNIALRLQELPDQPLASAAWPDEALYPDLELSAAVTDALSNPDKLADTAALMAESCGLAAGEVADLVPQISAVLRRLHADLPLLQKLAEELHAARWTPANADPVVEKQRRRAVLERLEGRDSNSQRIGPEVGFDAGAGAAAEAASAATVGVDLEQAPARVAQRSALSLPSNFYYSLPPSNFVQLSPAQMPQLLIPMVFHVMLYQDGAGIGPDKYDQASSYVQRLVDIANIMAKPANVQLFVKEVRNDPDVYPYLLLSNRATWLKVPLQNCTGSFCFSNAQFMYKNVWDFPRSINVFIASDSTAGVPLGYAYVPSSDLFPDSGHVFVSWDSLATSGPNSLSGYNDGPNTLLHEIFHHLGLEHPFDYSIAQDGSCVDGDYVIDTPASLRPISSSGFFATAQAYCLELFWGQYGGDWQAAYARWSTNLGIPDTDMNAWADSCPALAGFDELGNYMTYNTPVCFAALGHFTAAQAQRAMWIAAELNPVLYAWGQYFAQNAAPPPQASPPPEFVNNTCRNTAKSACACKAAWSLSGATYSYCDRIWSNNTLSCEVLDPSTCADCSSSSAQCILPCAGTPRICKRPPAPGARMPPPPPPRPPSSPPMPPPPPPRAVPSECKKTRSGCDCRSSWSYRGAFYGYCASPDKDPQLWCQVASTCATFNNSNPYQYCAANLSEPYCGGRVYFTTTRTPPTPPFPPSPPPDNRPRPPPSPPSTTYSGPVATVSGTFTLNANCALLNTNGAELRSGVLAELAQALSVPSSYLNITSMVCGSIVVTYLVAFPSGATMSQVNSVAAAAAGFSTTASASFTSRWGAVAKSSSTGVDILQPSAICFTGADGRSYCPPPAYGTPPPPATSSKKTFPWLWVIVGAGAGAVLLIAVLIAVIVVVARRRSRVVDSSQLQQRHSTVAVAVQQSGGSGQMPYPQPGAVQPQPYTVNAYGGAAPMQYYQQPAYLPGYQPPQPYESYPQQPYR